MPSLARRAFGDAAPGVAAEVLPCAGEAARARQLVAHGRALGQRAAQAGQAVAGRRRGRCGRRPRCVVGRCHCAWLAGGRQRCRIGHAGRGDRRERRRRGRRCRRRCSSGTVWCGRSGCRACAFGFNDFLRRLGAGGCRLRSACGAGRWRAGPAAGCSSSSNTNSLGAGAAAVARLASASRGWAHFTHQRAVGWLGAGHCGQAV